MFFAFRRRRRKKIMEIYEKIYDWDNLCLAYQNGSRGKRGRSEVAKFEYLLADNLLELQTELREKTYQPGRHVNFLVHEPKRRLISAAPFRDRLVHHALCNLTVPYFEKMFIADSYANRPGKGTHRAVDRCQQYARSNGYYLQGDLQQYFPSIDHAILLQTLRKMLPASEDMFELIGKILDARPAQLADEYQMVYFPGDDLFAAGRARGLPIGNLTSQWWANCYLNPLDHFVRRELGCKDYERYVDDFLLFSHSKSELWDWSAALIERAARLRVTLHPELFHPRPVTEGISFLGFVVFPDHRRLIRRKGIAYQRKLLAMVKTGTSEQIQASVRGWINHVRYADTYGLRRSVLKRAGLLAEGEWN